MPMAPWGSHFCQFYGNQADLIETLVPYFAAGLAENEHCLWITAEHGGVAGAREVLRDSLPDAERHIDRGVLDVLDCEDWYLTNGKFNANALLERWTGKLNEALARGCTGLRVFADEAWLKRNHWPAFAEYEATLNQALAGRPMLVLCAYPLEERTGREVFDVAHTHHFAIARRDGAWEMMEAAEHIGAKAATDRLNSILRVRVDKRTAELDATNAALREREQLYRLIAEGTGDIVSLYDLERNSIYVSPSANRVIGGIEHYSFDRVHPDDCAMIDRAWNRILAGEPQTTLYRHAHADGTWRWLEAQGSKVEYDGRTHVVAVSRDVTDRIHIQEQLEHSQKMDALGRFAGEIAHDFNNILTALVNYTSLLEKQVAKDSPEAEVVGAIRQVVEGARSSTKRLLTFSRRDRHNPVIVDVAEEARKFAQMVPLLITDEITFEADLGSGLIDGRARR